ncbi:MAG: glutamate--tRNA ligase [Clostridia bacterium]|nr:glutamate--tRNA ligase [Clostridia bacterium]
MDYQKLADLLFPDVTETPADLEARFPARQLPEGAKVTRFAPSPTGFVHFGGLFPVLVGERLAHQSGGVFYLRIEDTDARREVPGAAESLITTLEKYGIHFDEGAILGSDGKVTDTGIYGPYKQSVRGSIYHVYAKQLVRDGLAYPCFSTDEELEELANTDKKAEIKNMDWENQAAARKQAMLAQRDFTMEQVEAELAAGHAFVLRILADGDGEKKVVNTDLIRGKIEMPVNDEDFVLLKSDGIPTYHFAHAVDDHLMGTTHVIRGEEWLPSLPKHLQLFNYLHFRLPKYMHISQIMRLDENGNKKKLSKRDMGANLNDYARMGYCADAVVEYVLTLLNSNYEEWRTANPALPYTDFPFNIKKMSSSGCLFDFNKLNDVSKNVLSRMSADRIYDETCVWAEDNDPELYAHLTADPDYAKSIFAIGRGGKKPRKDFTVFGDVKPYLDFFYDDLFTVKDALPEGTDMADVAAAIAAFKDTYNEADDTNAWFDKVKAIAESLGYAADMKAYKADPAAFKGSVADISAFLRLAVTGRQNAPDLYTVMHLLGRERTFARLDSFLG